MNLKHESNPSCGLGKPQCPSCAWCVGLCVTDFMYRGKSPGQEQSRGCSLPQARLPFAPSASLLCRCASVAAQWEHSLALLYPVSDTGVHRDDFCRKRLTHRSVLWTVDQASVSFPQMFPQQPMLPQHHSFLTFCWGNDY